MKLVNGRFDEQARKFKLLNIRIILSLPV